MRVAVRNILKGKKQKNENMRNNNYIGKKAQTSKKRGTICEVIIFCAQMAQQLDIHNEKLSQLQEELFNNSVLYWFILMST